MGKATGAEVAGGGQGQIDTLVDSLREGFALCRMIRDDQGRVVDYVIAQANAAFLHGLGGRKALGKRLLELRPEITPDWFASCAAILAAGKPKRVEYWDPAAKRWYDAHMTPVAADDLIMLYVDVTRRKTAETRAQEQLRELNHRVKNNLNLVAAALTLQAREASEETRLALEQAVARVHTIAEVHNLLHRASRTDSVAFAEYLEDLCRKLENSLAPDQVKIILETDALQVTIEQAVELGVIVNELLTNAIKYAYPRGQPGEIQVNCHAVGKRLELTIRDFGKGMDAVENGGLGMKLVRSIVRHNGGDVSVQSEHGAHIRIRMPLQQAEVKQPA